MEIGASRAPDLGKDFGVSTEGVWELSSTVAGAAARVGAAAAGAVFSLSDGGKETVFVTSALLEDVELILALDASVSLAGLIDGLVVSSSL